MTEALALTTARRYDEARRLLMPADGGSREPEIFYDFIRLYITLETRGFDKARRLAKRMIELQPLVAWIRTLPMEVELYADRPAEAGRLFQRALDWAERPSERREVLWEAAARYLGSGHWPEAEQAARQAMELYPEGRVDFQTSIILTWALIRQGRLDEAEGVLQEALALRPRNADLLLTYASLDLVRAEPAAAERRVRDVLADGPARRTAFELLAVASMAQGRFDEAEVNARRALSMAPDREQHALLAWILIEGGSDLDEGIDLARKALDLPFPDQARLSRPPYWPTAEHALGLGYLRRGRHREAVEMLEQAAAAQPGNEQVRRHLAEARTGLE